MADTSKRPKSRNGDLILLLFVALSMLLILIEILGNLVSHLAG